MDKYSNTRIQNKGGSYVVRHESILFSSNFSPNEWFPHHIQKKAFDNRVHIILKFRKKFDKHTMKESDYIVEKCEIPDDFKLTAEHHRFIFEVMNPRGWYSREKADGYDEMYYSEIKPNMGVRLNIRPVITQTQYLEGELARLTAQLELEEKKE